VFVFFIFRLEIANGKTEDCKLIGIGIIMARAKLLLIPIKLITFDELLLLIYILRGATVQYVSYKAITDNIR
jgi:uncharacterized membrane protein